MPNRTITESYNSKTNKNESYKITFTPGFNS